MPHAPGREQRDPADGERLADHTATHVYTRACTDLPTPAKSTVSMTQSCQQHELLHSRHTCSLLGIGEGWSPSAKAFASSLLRLAGHGQQTTPMRRRGSMRSRDGDTRGFAKPIKVMWAPRPMVRGPGSGDWVHYVGGCFI